MNVQLPNGVLIKIACVQVLNSFPVILVGLILFGGVSVIYFPPAGVAPSLSKPLNKRCGVSCDRVLLLVHTINPHDYPYMIHIVKVSMRLFII